MLTKFKLYDSVHPTHCHSRCNLMNVIYIQNSMKYVIFFKSVDWGSSFTPQSETMPAPARLKCKLNICFWLWWPACSVAAHITNCTTVFSPSFCLSYSSVPYIFIQPMDWHQLAEMLFKDLPREALMRPLSRNEVVGMLLRLTIFGAATYYSIKWVVEAMDPTSKQKNQAKKRVYRT